MEPFLTKENDTGLSWFIFARILILFSTDTPNTITLSFIWAGLRLSELLFGTLLEDSSLMIISDGKTA